MSYEGDRSTAIGTKRAVSMKDWWKTFKPITGEIMFKSREGKTAKQEVKQILSQIDAHGKLKILDLCCGEGRHSIVLAKMKHDVTGLDFSKDFLAVATKKSKGRRLISNLFVAI